MAAFEIRGGQDLARITRELKHVGDGKTLRKRFSKELRAAAKPMVPAVRASIMAIPTHGDKHTGLRSRMARATKLTVRTSGKQAGVAVRVDGRKMPPGEGALPAYMEGTKKPWRHPTWGTPPYVTQQGHEYFYPVVRPLASKARHDVDKLAKDIANEIT